MVPGSRELWLDLCSRSRARPTSWTHNLCGHTGLCVGFDLYSAVPILEFLTMLFNKGLSMYLALDLQIVVAGSGLGIWLILSSNSSYKLIFQRLSLLAALFPNGLSSWFQESNITLAKSLGFGIYTSVL